MASPFSVFRRNQRAMIAVLGILCMFAFVFLPILFQSLDSAGSAGNPVVVRTRYGDLRETELFQLRRRTAQLNQYLERLVAQVVFNLRNDPQGFFREVGEQQLFSLLASQLQQQGFLIDPSEQFVVENFILARTAEELGLRVSNATINEFLGQVSQDMTGDQLRQVLSQVEITEGTLFEALRDQLLSMRLQQSLFRGMQGEPPAQRWDYYQRLNRRATAEVLPVSVDAFLDQVPAPNDATLKAFYEQYKDRYPDPNSPEPGFRLPERARFEYFRADYEVFAEQIEVSDDDVRQYYEEQKDTRFLYSGPDWMSDSGAPHGAGLRQDDIPEGTLDELRDAADGAPSGEAPSDETNGDDPSAATDAQPDEGSDGDGDDSPGAGGAGASESSDSASGEGPALGLDPQRGAGGDDAGGGSQPDDGGSASANLLTFSDDDQPSAADAPADSAPAGEGSQADTGTDEDPLRGETPAAGETAAALGAASPTATPPADQGRWDAATEWLLERNIDGGPNPTYDPLWKVADEIRKELAAQRAAEKIEEVFNRLAARVDQYALDRVTWEFDREEGRDTPEPKPLDLPALASEHPGISAHETPLLSAREMFETTQIGQSRVDGRQPFATAAFTESSLYQPRRSADAAGNRYLFWKIETAAETVPPLDEIRDQVVEAWKRTGARDLALAHAQQLASDARASGTSLVEQFPPGSDPAAVSTGSFSWLTLGTAPGAAPRLSGVTGVESPGPEFMSTVFGLEENQVDVAFNHPRSVAYVIRVTQLEPRTEVLERSFMVDSFQRYEAAATLDRRQLADAWRKQIERDAGLEWTRPPQGTM